MFFTALTKLHDLSRRERHRWQLERLGKRNRKAALQIKEGPILFVLEADNVGLFAHLTWCIYLANWAQTVNRKIAFACVSLNYRDANGPANWLPEILDQAEGEVPRSGESLARMTAIRLGDLNEFCFSSDRLPVLTLQSGRDYFRKIFRLSVPVEAEVDRTLLDWRGFFLVGVHYRGTDKKIEAPVVDHAIVIDRLRQISGALELQGIRSVKFFVATDDAAFLARARRELGPAVIYREQVQRSMDGTPVHHAKTPNSGSRNAFDAMTDAWLLSRCPILVRTASFLSGWSVMLAERQLVFMLNRPYASAEWFPDADIIKASASFDSLGEEIAAFLHGRLPPHSRSPLP